MSRIKVLSQYIKDLSFEVPNAPSIFLEKHEKPNINLTIDIDAKKINQDISEVTLKINAKATADEKVVFICEAAYSALFAISDIKDEEIEQILLIYCPNILFPFVRRIISNAVSDGGFLPLMIEPIDFFDLYNKRKNLNGSNEEAHS